MQILAGARTAAMKKKKRSRKYRTQLSELSSFYHVEELISNTRPLSLGGEGLSPIVTALVDGGHLRVRTIITVGQEGLQVRVVRRCPAFHNITTIGPMSQP